MLLNLPCPKRTFLNNLVCCILYIYFFLNQNIKKETSTVSVRLYSKTSLQTSLTLYLSFLLPIITLLLWELKGKYAPQHCSPFRDPLCTTECSSSTCNISTTEDSQETVFFLQLQPQDSSTAQNVNNYRTADY